MARAVILFQATVPGAIITGGPLLELGYHLFSIELAVTIFILLIPHILILAGLPIVGPDNKFHKSSKNAPSPQQTYLSMLSFDKALITWRCISFLYSSFPEIKYFRGISTSPHNVNVPCEVPYGISVGIHSSVTLVNVPSIANKHWHRPCMHK